MRYYKYSFIFEFSMINSVGFDVNMMMKFHNLKDL